MEVRARDVGVTGLGRTLVVLALLWLGGASLRITLLAIPPVIPDIHRDLGLNETGIGILSSLPILMLAWAAIPGSLLISRFGALRTLIFGCALTAIASAVRALAVDTLTLDLVTVVMGIGIAVMQPSLPPLVRRWLPNRIGFATAIYTNGWLVAETLAVWLTIPYVLPMVHGSWQLSLVIWSIPVAIAAVCIAVFAPRQTGAAPSAATRRWWPDWRNGLMWRLAFTLGGANLAYWSSNAFIPDFLTHVGRPEMIGQALTSLNLGQVPISILFLFIAGRLAGKLWPICTLAGLMLAGTLGFVFSDGIWCILCAGLLGATTAGVMILVLTLPPMLAAAEDVPRMSAGMFTVSYNCSVVASVLGGVLWDATQSPYPAFALIALGAVVTMVLPALGAGLRHRPRAAAA